MVKEPGVIDVDGAAMLRYDPAVSLAVNHENRRSEQGILGGCFGGRFWLDTDKASVPWSRSEF